MIHQVHPEAVSLPAVGELQHSQRDFVENRRGVELYLASRIAIGQALDGTHYLRTRGWSIRGIGLIVVFITILSAGCGSKLTRKGVPFNLDRVFPGIFAVESEAPKQKGLRLVREKDYLGAIEAFKGYVLEQPEDFFGFNAIAVCYKNLGDNAKAMQNYERALEFSRTPEQRAKVLSNIGNLYNASGKYQVALGYFKEAYNEFSQNPTYLILIARTFIYLDEPTRAQKVVNTIEQAVGDLPKYERDEDRGLGYYLLAQVYIALDEEDKLFEALRKALKGNPSRFAARLESDSSDETNLLFTIRDDPRLKKLIRTYSG